MRLKWRNLPAIITLLAGFIACVVTTVQRYPLNIMLWVLIAVMTVFYIVGLCIRAAFMHFLETEDESGEEDSDEAVDTEETDEDDQNDESGDQSGQPVINQ